MVDQRLIQLLNSSSWDKTS